MVIMGCLQSTPSPPKSQFGFEEEEDIEAISYNKRTEKIVNELNPDNHAVTGGGFWKRRKTIEKKHHKDRITPSTMNLDMIRQDSDSLYDSSVFTLDLLAITNTEKHWHFPKWGHYKKCTFCGCECHQKAAQKYQKSTKKKQNNFKRSVSFIGLELDTPMCPMALTNLLAMNALDLTAPASDALLKNRKNAWIQLSGHPGAFAPAGPHTIWKKRLTKENTETVTYGALMTDLVRDLIPRFYRQVEYNDDYFIEIEDLLQHFRDPAIMDIKMGTRTFLESEVKNPILRKDLYEKMIKLNPDEPTPQEHEDRAVTKLRYMQFREQGSSTATLGFRIEAAKSNSSVTSRGKLQGQEPNTDLKKVKSREEVKRVISNFLNHNNTVRLRLLERFREIQYKFSLSPFFKTHEIIGSSLLVMYDRDSKAGVWMIDFAKVIPVETSRSLTHRAKWEVGNHEDGYLTGLDNLIRIFEELDWQESKLNNSGQKQDNLAT